MIIAISLSIYYIYIYSSLTKLISNKTKQNNSTITECVDHINISIYISFYIFVIKVILQEVTYKRENDNERTRKHAYKIIIVIILSSFVF